jgi:N-acetylglucosaminyldiphosphoundecaprenol N-acetyl-beta-D-mannosaminyltransferase
MRECVLASPQPFTHYFLGGSDDCVNRLVENFCSRNSSIRVIGLRSGYFKPEEEPAIVEEINRLGPDFVWVGLGTPKQQEWIYRWKPHIRRGAVMAVGFAFDVNSGTKKDAPLWMQRRGLTWMYRLLAEPRRLAGRYLRYNSLFLIYLIWDGICGKAFVPGERDTRSDGRPAP